MISGILYENDNDSTLKTDFGCFDLVIGLRFGIVQNMKEEKKLSKIQGFSQKLNLEL